MRTHANDQEWDRPPADPADAPGAAPLSPEVAAMRNAPVDVLPGSDPGRSDESALVDEHELLPEDHFGDEEPEQARWRPPDEHELDLEERLEAQHYAFPAEADEP